MLGLPGVRAVVARDGGGGGAGAELVYGEEGDEEGEEGVVIGGVEGGDVAWGGGDDVVVDVKKGGMLALAGIGRYRDGVYIGHSVCAVGDICARGMEGEKERDCDTDSCQRHSRQRDLKDG